MNLYYYTSGGTSKGNDPWKKDLEENGFAVVKLSGWKSSFKDDFFTFLEKSSRGKFDRKNSETWTETMFFKNMGLIKDFFGHTEFQWQIRELCLPIFAEIYGCKEEELICSFDGGTFATAHIEPKFWPHVDFPATGLDLEKDFCIQGVVNFHKNGDHDGGLVVLPGSHKQLAEYFERFLAKYPERAKDWNHADVNDFLIKNRDWMKINAEEGDLILWDSRCFHYNYPPFYFEPDGYRMCTYVSMVPRNRASFEELKLRVEIYEKGLMTGHWCYGPWLSPVIVNPSILPYYPEKREIAPLNEKRARMIGYFGDHLGG